MLVSKRVVHILSLSLLLAMLPAGLRAQWRLVTKLPSIGGTVYFLDKVGARNVGFVGCQGHIVRTSDGGKTWTTVYSSQFAIDLRDFVFKDPLNGIAVGSRLFSYLTTTDGGVTWQMTGRTTFATSITYLPNTNVLTVNTVTMSPAFSSTDWGQNWSQTVVPPGQNGMAFGDSLVGIFSAHASGAPLYRTTDGAKTWKGTNFSEHIYSPIALAPLAGVFIGAAELSSELWISRDSGETWIFRSKMSPLVPSGCLRYYDGHLWCQTAANGMFVSDDTGLTWTSLCGPSRNIDSRFYNLDSTLIAADNQSNLWMMDDATKGPGASLMSFRQVPVVMTSPQCGLADKRIDLLMNVCFDILDSAYLTGSPRLQITYPPLPAALTSGSGVVIRYIPDSVHVFDTAYLHLAWGPPGHRLRDTTIQILASVGGAVQSVNLPQLFAELATTCQSLDTTLEIKSVSCDQESIVAIWLDDSSVFHLTPPPLPDTLDAHGSIFIRVTANVKDSGTYSTVLRMKIRTARGTIDTSSSVSLDVHESIHPTASAIKVLMANLCDWQDTVLWLHNPHCRTLTLERTRGSDTNLIVLDPLQPVSIPPGDSVAIHIRVLPSGGKSLKFVFVTVRSDSVVLDTSYSVTAQTINNTIPTPRLTSSPLKFGLTSGCSQKQLPLVIFNNKCGDVKLLEVKWSVTDPQFWFDPVSLPTVLPPGTSDSIVFHYKPALLKQSTVAITLTFQISGERRDTTIYISGTGADTESAVLNNETLSYPTISKCESSIDSVIFENVSCDTMDITSLYDWEQNGYKVLSPKLPIRILPGDSVPIVIRLARNADGLANDSIDIEYASNKPPHSPLRLRVNLLGNIQTPYKNLILTGDDFENIHLPPCAEFDSFVIISNVNECDTSTISMLYGLNGVIARRALPFALAPGSRDTIRFHYTPQDDTATGWLRIAGSAIDTQIKIYTLRAHSEAISCKPSTLAAFVATMCHVASDSLLITATGCDSALIDRIEILPASSNFRILQQYSLPKPLNGQMRVSLRYDPSLGGADTAALYLHSADGKLDMRIPLTAFTTTLQSARLALRNDTSTAVTNVEAGKTTNITLFVRDAIEDSLALSDVSCNIALNENIMTLLYVTPGPHFTNIGSSQQQSGVALQLRRSDHTSLAPNSTLATLEFTTFVSDTISTSVALQNVRFNVSDNDYERCMLRPLAEPDNVTVTIAPSCTRDLLTSEMAGSGLLTSIHIRPSVVSDDGRLTLDLTSAKATIVNVRLVNILGQETAHAALPVAAGSTSLLLPFSDFPSGLTFVQVSAGGVTSTERVLVQH